MNEKVIKHTCAPFFNLTRKRLHITTVQLDFTPEGEVFHMLFERCHSKNRKRSIKQHIKYLYFRSKIQLDHLVDIYILTNAGNV